MVEHRGRLRATAALGAHGAVVGLCAFVAYWAVFSVFAPYDDTGYHEWSLQLFASGHALYNDVFSYYGPFHYELWGGLSALTGVTITSDVGGLVAWVLWLGASMALALVTVRMTGRLVLGLIVQILSFAILTAFRNEPMYAGDTALVLTVGILATATFVLPRRPRLATIVIGGLLGSTLLTKINVGTFAAIAVGYAAVMSLPLRRTRIARGLAISAVVLVGPAVMAPTLDTGWTQRYALLIAASTLGLVGVTARLRSADDRSATEATRWTRWLLSGLLGTVAFVLVLLLLLGTSPRAVYDALVTASSQATVFPFPLPLPTDAVYWVVVVVLVTFPWVPRFARSLRVGGFVTAGMRILVGLSILTSLVAFGPWSGSVHQAPFEWSLPLAWLAAVPPAGPEPRLQARFLRTLVPTLAVMHSLVAYPVAGTQVAFASVLFLLCGAVCLSDGWNQLRALLSNRPGTPLRSAPTVILGGLCAVLAGLFVNQYVVQPGRLYKGAYVAGMRLPFTGASRLRLPAAQARDLSRVVTTLRARCRSVFTMPGMLSLNLWSALPAPSGLHEQPWWAVLSSTQQKVALARARAAPRLCVVRNDALIAFWWGFRPLPTTPLVRFITHDFVPIARFGDYAISVRANDSPPPGGGRMAR